MAGASSIWKKFRDIEDTEKTVGNWRDNVHPATLLIVDGRVSEKKDARVTRFLPRSFNLHLIANPLRFCEFLLFAPVRHGNAISKVR